MLKLTAILLVLLACGNAHAADEFDNIKCTADIRAGLINKKATNGSAMATEARHKDLALKNLGGDEISDALFLGSWQICGNEYELLIDTKTSIIRDVLRFPPHSKKQPMSTGECRVNGIETRDYILAILDNSAGLNARSDSKAMLKTTAAWKVDPIHKQFVPMKPEALSCPLDGIVTQDGGR